MWHINAIRRNASKASLVLRPWPIWRQAFAWTSIGEILTGPLETNVSLIWIKISWFLLKLVDLKCRLQNIDHFVQALIWLQVYHHHGPLYANHNGKDSRVCLAFGSKLPVINHMIITKLVKCYIRINGITIWTCVLNFTRANYMFMTQRLCQKYAKLYNNKCHP